ncbi:MAG: YedE-related selenium metabolism membrane protein [Synergistaceae bacterium]|jgi:YedE family putative selenium metabolism protein|nr:YedE-related selenium metabolism membrane protein [Synergistaceae bacterium]
MRKNQNLIWLLITGSVVGALAILLMKMGNPPNMGICVACFIRDTAGALGFDGAPPVQYIRPEIAGLLLGSFVIAHARKEFRSFGGSSPLVRFVIAFFVMFGALVFLGCPLRMILRLAAGDLNALVGLAGFASGIAVGSIWLRKGFTLGRACDQPSTSGFIMPAIALTLLAFLVIRPAFIKFSAEGPGSMHAPVLASFAAALLIAALAQRSRMCMAGGIRDMILIKNPNLLLGYIAVFAAALIANIATGGFKLGFEGQPIAHTNHLWNFLGMSLVGYGSSLLGGCPLRQVIMAGEGNSDAGICVLGFLAGGAAAHNFGAAASAAGVPLNGQIAVAAGLVVLSCAAALCTFERKAGTL